MTDRGGVVLTEPLRDLDERVLHAQASIRRPSSRSTLMLLRYPSATFSKVSVSIPMRAMI